jgi:diguanylate cyclase (GGDEF)-like protein
MSNGSDGLWMCAAALAVTSASLTGFGLRQSRHGGWRWWLAALWLTALGAAAAAAGWALPASLLLMQWPVLTLIGLRRFHARTPLPLNERADWAALALAAAAAIGAAAAASWSGDGTPAAWLSAAAAIGVHLYAACLLLCAPGGRDAAPLPWLALAMAAVALLPMPAAWPGYELMAPLGLRTAAATLGAVVMAFAALTLVNDRTERQLRDSQRRLRVLANMDPLTNVPNRRHFDELATLALRSDKPGSATLMMFDIDHFKRINDALGHAAGDRALRLVCGSMLEHLRAHDVAGRHGGDEFALLLRDTGVADAGGVAARIVTHLQSQAEASVLPPLSLSFGMVQVRPGEGINEALRRADQALYEAKRQGRSRAVTAEGGDGGDGVPLFSESRRLGLTAS